MGETELELTEHVRSPAALVRLEAKAGGVDERDDSERHAAVGKVDAADTSVVLNLNTEEVFIGDFLGVAGGLNTLHHERIFRGNLLLDTLLLLHLGDIILDFCQVESKLLVPVGNTSSWSIDSATDEPVSVVVGEVFSSDEKSLLNEEGDAKGSDLTMLIVDFNLTFSHFVWKEDVLVENTLHSGSTLVDAAPGLDHTSFRLSFADDKVNGLLTDSKNLLVLHVIMLISAV